MTTERKIYFFRLSIGAAGSGKPLPFDPAPVLEHIAGLSWSSTGRYLDDPDGKVTCCWVDDTHPPQEIRLGNVRHFDLPQVENAGDLTPLEISADSGISDQTHIVFFDHNLIGADFNYYGPRVTRLSDYFHHKAPRFFQHTLYLEALLKHDVLEELEKFGDIRLFNLKLRAPYASFVRQADDDLGSAFEAAAKAGSAEELEVILKTAPYSQKTLSNRLLTIAKQLVGMDGLRSGLSRFVIKGFNEETKQVELLDLLNDKLVSKKHIVLLDARSRALNQKSAYDAIRAAYAELHDELIESAGIEL